MAGKGSKPRNNYSKQFRDNWDLIDWCLEGIKQREKEEIKAFREDLADLKLKQPIASLEKINKNADQIGYSLGFKEKDLTKE